MGRFKRFFVHCAFCILMINLYSCSSRNMIEVMYIDHCVEFSTALLPWDFLDCFKNVHCDTVIVPALEFDSISNGIKKTTKKNAWGQECRFCIKTNDKLVFSDNFFYAFTYSDDSVSMSPRIFYLIRKYAGYYNRIPEEDLDYIYDSHYFNLHQDYKYTPPKRLGLSPACEDRVRVILFREE